MHGVYQRPKNFEMQVSCNRFKVSWEQFEEFDLFQRHQENLKLTYLLKKYESAHIIQRRIRKPKEKWKLTEVFHSWQSYWHWTTLRWN